MKSSSRNRIIIYGVVYIIVITLFVSISFIINNLADKNIESLKVYAIEKTTGKPIPNASIRFVKLPLLTYFYGSNRAEYKARTGMDGIAILNIPSKMMDQMGYHNVSAKGFRLVNAKSRVNMQNEIEYIFIMEKINVQKINFNNNRIESN